MFLIVGLGNPGPKYANTRHNVGFRAIHQLANQYNITSTSNKFKSLIAQGRIANNKVILAEPLTYMNNSGEAVRLIADYFKIEPEKIIIIYDDFALPLGKIRIKKKGSAGGHNGLRSIINLLGTKEIPRIRVGIDSPPERYAVVDYVLGHFSKDEEQLIEDAVENVSAAVELIISDGFQTAMNRYN